MKYSPLLLSALMCSAVFFSACSKNNNGSQPVPPAAAAKYPATVTKTDAAGRLATTYEYNDKNQLIKYRRDDGVMREFGTAQIVETVPSLTVTAVNTWNFENMTTKNVYEGGSVRTMHWETTYINFNGTQWTDMRGNPIFSSLEDGRMTSSVTELYVTQPTTSLLYTYDDKKNLKQIEFFTSDQTTRPFSRLKVMGVDDKPAPFSAVRGFQWLSYPQAYPIDYSFGYCLNNPTQIIIETYDKNSNSYKLSEQDDFTYTYDADGYPTAISLNITWYAAVNTYYSASYAIVYK